MVRKMAQSNTWAGLARRRVYPRPAAFAYCVRLAVIYCATLLGWADWHDGGFGKAASAQRPQPDTGRNPEKEETTRVDRAHEAISRAVVAPAAWLDSFFGEEESDTEKNKSHIRVKFGGLVEEGSGFRDTVKVGGKLVLPETGDRLNLLIGSDADGDRALENTSVDNVQERTTERDKENVGLGLQYFLHRSDRSNLSAAAGVRLSGTTPIGTFSTRYRYSLPLDDDWLARYVQRVQWITRNEFIVPSRLDFERPLAEGLLFRTSFNGTWFEDEDGYFYGGSILVREQLDAESAISYEWTNQFRTEPHNRLEEIAVRARYRQTVWRKWLKFDLVPQLAFPRERDFDPTPGIYAGFEVSFGG